MTRSQVLIKLRSKASEWEREYENSGDSYSWGFVEGLREAIKLLEKE